jgi:hypothetical protein
MLGVGMSRKPGRVTATHPAGDGFAVLTVTRDADEFRHCRAVCAECPWRKDRPAGVFPPEAFRLSAGTCEDIATTVFACHMTPSARPASCAGFLLSDDAAHNLALRLHIVAGRFHPRAVKADPAVPTYSTYSDMAVANGVDPGDPALRATRSRARGR